MLRHLLKLIWKRKARNMMLSLEILIAFVLVFAIAAFALRNLQLHRMPTGFQYQDVWSAQIRIAGGGKIDQAEYDNLTRTLRAMPEVEHVAFATFSPYTLSDSSTSFLQPGSGAKLRSSIMTVSDDFFDAMGMTAVDGRWFSGTDDGAAATPVVINKRMAAKLFPGKSAVGRQFSDDDKDASKRRSYKISAVIDDYRGQGELMPPVSFVFMRFVPPAVGTPRTIMLKLKAGTPRAFEARLNRQLKLVRSDWGYEISPLADLRSTILRLQMVPLLVLTVIAAFLLVMVAFGLFGVLWQNTTQRIPEIGLRRALGADAGSIYRQIIAEQLLLSSGAMAIALLLLVQLPLTGAFGESLNWPVFIAAAASAMTVIYLLSLLCALYPGWRASRLSPTQALHYE